MIKVKRIYEEPTGADGTRVLVDRLWPRGVSKEKAQLDAWLKDIAPSTELRTWFGHKPERFKEFSQKYIDELSRSPALPEIKQLLAGHKTVTLLYAAKDPAVNHAVVLHDFLKQFE